jgi:hypothetical protein
MPMMAAAASKVHGVAILRAGCMQAARQLFEA